MSTATSAEQMALRGLLLVVVEVQNILRQASDQTAREDLIETCGQIHQLVESAPTAELVQLARAALDNPVHVVPAAIPAAAAGIHS